MVLGAYPRHAEMIRGRAPRSDVHAQAVSAIRRAARVARAPYVIGSPLLRRAQRRSRGPADTDLDRPAESSQSSDNVRGERPPSIVAMITGQASSVVANRARTLLDGISLRAYPTAPSMQISAFSPGLRANGFGSVGLEKSNSGISRSGSSI